MTDTTTWDTVVQLKRWLDDNDGLPAEQAPVMRLLKLQEEIGEAAQAMMGTLGTNPRKGNSHTQDDVEAEVCDVVLSGMVLLATLTSEPGKRFAERLEFVAERSLT